PQAAQFTLWKGVMMKLIKPAKKQKRLIQEQKKLLPLKTATFRLNQLCLFGSRQRNNLRSRSSELTKNVTLVSNAMALGNYRVHTYLTLGFIRLASFKLPLARGTDQPPGRLPCIGPIKHQLRTSYAP
ncbi:Uncharacterized protein ALO78_02830, partial [Pseudomonas amygdali pv. ciccaronei]